MTVSPDQHIGITLVLPWAPVLQCSHSSPVAECTRQGTGDADNRCHQAPPALGRTIGLGGSALGEAARRPLDAGPRAGHYTSWGVTSDHGKCHRARATVIRNTGQSWAYQDLRGFKQ